MELRAQRGVSLVDADLSRRGPTEKPAGISAFVTARGSIDYVHKSQNDETGLANASVVLSGAVRLAGLVAETLALWAGQTEAWTSSARAPRLVL